MIVTVTLNPALDLFLHTEDIEFDTVLRASDEQRRAGGKGLNVARMLRVLGEPTRAVLLAGRETGEEIVRLAREEGLDVEPVAVPEPTRINVVVQDGGGRRIKVNAAGAAPGPEAIGTLADVLEKLGTEMRALVVSGALPPGVMPGFYAQLVGFANGHGAASFVDTSGEALRHAIPARPGVLKINAAELGDLFERQFTTAGEIAAAAAELRGEGIAAVCVTRGSDGALLCDETGAWQAAAPLRTARRAVGAGDSFLAGLISAYLADKRGGELLSRAIACGTAWAVREHHGRLSAEEIERLREHVRVAAVE